MITVGLTGGIATGKSTVADFFRSLGAPVIDSDILVHQSLSPAGEAYHGVVEAFGPDIVTANGQIDRARLGRIVFADKTQRDRLNRLVHPVVEAHINRQLADLRAAGNVAAIVDVPLLFEVGWEDRFDLIVLVYLPKGIQRERLLRRNALTKEEADRRMSAQWPLRRKLKKADFVIDNSGTPEETMQQARSVWAHVLRMAANGKENE